MFTKTLHPDTLRGLDLVASEPIIQRSYLAGGTALALQLGHRMSIDLDFFTREEFDENVLEINLQKFSEFSLQNKSWRTITGTMGRSKFSIFYYKYPIIGEMERFREVNILGKKDIAAMKLHSITGRGVKRDYVDLFFLRKEFRMQEVASYYEQKYGNFSDQATVILRSLNYFEEADRDVMPNMLAEVDWEQVKLFFEQEARDFAKEYLGLGQ